MESHCWTWYLIIYEVEKKIENMLNKGIIKAVLNRETILYLVFGIFTTIVNFGSFIIFEHVCGEKFYLWANVCAFICATLFAFVTNKKYVFQSDSWKFVVICKELISFFSGRILTFLIIEELGLYIAVEFLKMKNIKIAMFDGKLIAKIILAFVAVLANYIFGKFFVFKSSWGDKKTYEKGTKQ